MKPSISELSWKKTPNNQTKSNQKSYEIRKQRQTKPSPLVTASIARADSRTWTIPVEKFWVSFSAICINEKNLRE